MNLDEIFLKSYLNEFNEKEQKKITHSQEDRAIAAQKKKQLEIMENFLQKFVDLEIVVNHKDQYSKNTAGIDGMNPQKFNFYLVDSSKTWSPGISIFFDHPCEVEIAIPNKPQIEGVVVIKVASHHPDSYILEQKFNSFESACEALARFLSKCTVKIGKDPKKIIKKSSNTDFLNNVPDEPPVYENTSSIKEIETPPSLSLKKISDLFVIHKNKKTTDSEEN